MTPDTAALRVLADAATPGPWSAANEHGLLGPNATPAWCVSRMTEPTQQRPDGWLYDIAYVERGDREHSADAAYIAALDPDTVRALCDAADEVERLRALLAVSLAYLDGAGAGVARLRDQRDASRTAHAALVAELRALCDRYEHADDRHERPTGQQVAAKVANLLDRHALTTGDVA